MLITISGLYGSGGNELGEDLAKDLGYELYDGKLIEKAVEDSGIDMLNSTLSFYDEQDSGIDENFRDPYSSALLKLQMDVLPIGREEPGFMEHKHSGLLSSFLDSAPVNHREGNLIRRKDDIDTLRFAQAKVILDAAEKGNGIFLGRCSSYVLRGRKDTLNVFTCASIDSCRTRIREKYGIEGEDDRIDALCKTTNRRRAYYYETFTSQKWDDLENYDVCIDTDYLGYDGTLELLKHLIKIKSEG